MFKIHEKAIAFWKGTLALGRHSESECLEIFLLFYCHCYKQHILRNNIFKKTFYVFRYFFKKKTTTGNNIFQPIYKSLPKCRICVSKWFSKTWNYIKFWSLLQEERINISADETSSVNFDIFSNDWDWDTKATIAELLSLDTRIWKSPLSAVITIKIKHWNKGNWNQVFELLYIRVNGQFIKCIFTVVCCH